MDLTKEFQQRKEFCDILFELAKSQELLQDAYYRSNMYKRLESLYDAESKELIPMELIERFLENHL